MIKNKIYRNKNIFYSLHNPYDLQESNKKVFHSKIAFLNGKVKIQANLAQKGRIANIGF